MTLGRAGGQSLTFKGDDATSATSNSSLTFSDNSENLTPTAFGAGSSLGAGTGTTTFTGLGGTIQTSGTLGKVTLPSTAAQTTAVNAGASTTSVSVNAARYVTTGTGFKVYDGSGLGTIVITFATNGA